MLVPALNGIQNLFAPYSPYASTAAFFGAASATPEYSQVLSDIRDILLDMDMRVQLVLEAEQETSAQVYQVTQGQFRVISATERVARFFEAFM